MRISRATELSSTTNVRNRCIASGTIVRRSASLPIPTRTVKKNVVPTPGSLSSPISPPIISTNVLLMVSPSPVPPCLRVVDISACVNGWNNLAHCSRVMPGPVSRTVKRSTASWSDCSNTAAFR